MPNPDCVFCGITSGRLPAAYAFQDPHAVAIMDKRQPGWPEAAHVLVMPREHVSFIDDLDPDSAGRLIHVVVEVSQGIRRVFGPDGISVWQSNGSAAGQEVDHVHIHVLTRTHGDWLLRVYPSEPATPPLNELSSVASKLSAELP